MAFVPGFKYDVFISYAHLDNEPLVAGGSRWVYQLGQAIRTALRQRLASKDCEIYFDNISLHENHRISGISDRVRESAVLMVVMSDGYLHSKFCMEEEFKVFLERGPHAAENIFVVRKTPLSKTVKEPDILHDIVGAEFFVIEDEHPYTLGQEIGIDERYTKLIGKSATRLADVLRNQATIEDGRSTPAVFLAEVTDDLESQRDQVKSYLEQYGVRIVPLSPYPRPGFRAPADRDMKQARAFMQLLGAHRGRQADEAPRGYAWLQLERAEAAKLPVYQWRSPELDLESVADDQRKLLELATVQKTPLTEFQSYVRQQVLAAPEDRPQVLPKSIYIDHDLEDEKHAEDLQDRLTDDWHVARTPRFPGDANALRRARDKRMLEYESVIFLYGSVDQEWIDGELSEFMKIEPERVKPPLKQALVVTPPAVGTKPSPSVKPKGTKEIKAPNGIDDATVDEIKSYLKSP